MSVPEIGVLDLKALHDENASFTLLDVREDDELATASVDFALHIPMGHVPERSAELPKDGKIVVMCHHGGRSARVTRYLLDQGFAGAVNLDGGIDAWAADVDSSLARY